LRELLVFIEFLLVLLSIVFNRSEELRASGSFESNKFNPDSFF